MTPATLDLAGDVRGRHVLDAGAGHHRIRSRSGSSRRYSSSVAA
jgi:hypothetical protein